MLREALAEGGVWAALEVLDWHRDVLDALYCVAVQVLVAPLERLKILGQVRLLGRREAIAGSAPAHAEENEEDEKATAALVRVWKRRGLWGVWGGTATSVAKSVSGMVATKVLRLRWESMDPLRAATECCVVKGLLCHGWDARHTFRAGDPATGEFELSDGFVAWNAEALVMSLALHCAQPPLRSWLHELLRRLLAVGCGDDASDVVPAIASVVLAHLALHPLDTVYRLLLMQHAAARGSKRRFRSATDCAAAVLRDAGPAGFYGGAVPSSLKLLLATSLVSALV